MQMQAGSRLSNHSDFTTARDDGW